MLDFLDKFNQICMSFGVFPLIFILGGILTWKLRGLQFSGCKLGFGLLVKNKQDSVDHGQGQISRYEAVAGILAGNFGTGNITGMAVAIACGGPGTLVWIWLAALLGAIVQFAGSFLGIKYRKAQGNGHGEFIGGPAACFAFGLNSKSLAVLFCLFTLMTAFSAGNVVQVSCIVPLCANTLWSKALVGMVLALLVTPVLIGGNNRILKFSAGVIPFIAGFYVLFCACILAMHSSQIFPALQLILSSAFGVKTAVAGLGGYTFAQVISTGMSRAIMATDCGSGMVSILQSNSNSKNPVIDGLVTLVPPIIVMGVCSITMLVLIVTGAYKSETQGTLMVLYAFKNSLGAIGGGILVAAILLFGYTTILTWFACAEKSLGYMMPGKGMNTFLKVAFIAVIPFGGLVDMRVLWMLGDAGFAGMVVLNSIALIALFKDVLATNHEVARLKISYASVARELPQQVDI